MNEPIYMAGVEAAPHFKHRELGQDIFRDGIPDDSIVLRNDDEEAGSATEEQVNTYKHASGSPNEGESRGVDSESAQQGRRHLAG